MTVKRFDGLTVLVSGATGGFGRRSAERFSDEGAKLVLTDVDTDRLREAAAAMPGPVETLAGDIADESLSASLVALAIEKFGRLDIAVNVAGIAQSLVKLPDLSSEEARRVIDVDLMAVFYAMKHQLPAMERQFKEGGKGGAIVNIASVAGLVGAPKLSVYAAAKHGVVGLTRTAALEFATKGIRVNAICPSFARTRMAQDFVRLTGGAEADALADLSRGVPMKRVAEIDEVVEAILFAADPRNSFMTGHALNVDGGIGAM